MTPDRPSLIIAELRLKDHTREERRRRKKKLFILLLQQLLIPGEFILL